MFESLIGKEVKVPYRDGEQFKIARGILIEESNNFIKISGKLGTIFLNLKNVERVSEVKKVIL